MCAKYARILPENADEIEGFVCIFLSQKSMTKEIVLHVMAISSEGEGIGYVENKVCFVAGALPQQVVRVRIVEEKKRYSRAIAIALLEDSVKRTTLCPHTECGGCAFAQLGYAEQTAYKQKKVEDAFERIGKIATQCTVQYEKSPVLYHYRNKMEFAFGYTQEGRVDIGLYSWRSHAIVPVQYCAVAPIGCMEIVQCVRDFLQYTSVPPYGNGEGFWRHLVLHYSPTMQCFRVHIITSDIPRYFHVVQMLLSSLKNITLDTAWTRDVAHKEEDIPSVKRCSSLEKRTIQGIHSVRRSSSKFAFGDKRISPTNPEVFYTKLGNTVLHYGENSFFQINTVVATMLYTCVKKHSINATHLLDVCCGVGSAGLFCMDVAKTLCGIEINEEAVRYARKNASFLPSDMQRNVDFICADMQHIASHGYRADTVIVNPPRSGLAKEVVLFLLSDKRIRHVMYISCNPATLARDIALMQKAYTIQNSDVFDMFPHTPHCETLVVLERL